jgi:DNA-binding response OmpR family regulator
MEGKAELSYQKIEYKQDRILLVEDDPDNRYVEEIYLKLEGYNVTPVSTADEAKPFIDNEYFDLYLLDTKLPCLSGIELCRYILARRPEGVVLFFSSAARFSDIDQGKMAGAQGYLTKPLGFELLLETVARLIYRKKLSDTEKTQESEQSLRIRIADFPSGRGNA